MRAYLVVAVVAATVALLVGASTARGDAAQTQMRICTAFLSPPQNVTFGFTLTPTTASPDHLGPGCSLPFPISPGTSYSLTETLPAGWLLVSATCTRTNGTTFVGTTGTLDGATITGIEAQPGELVGCTFVNAQAPTTKDECSKGVWQNFGGVFKNQGDCISYVATGGKNQP